MKKLLSFLSALILFPSLALAGTSFPPYVPGQITGTATNNNATAGNVGEDVVSNIASGSAVALTNGVPANVTSISLTAGDWEVWGAICTNPGGTTTQSVFIGGINSTSATRPATDGFYWSVGAGVIATGSPWCQSVAPVRASLASTTTYYLVTQSNFGVSTNAAYGYIEARRMR